MKNWSGSSKSMEAAVILQMVKDYIALGFIVGSIVSDDDSVIRTHLLYNNNPRKKVIKASYQNGSISQHFWLIPPTE